MEKMQASRPLFSKKSPDNPKKDENAARRPKKTAEPGFFATAVRDDEKTAEVFVIPLDFSPFRIILSFNNSPENPP